MEIAIAVFTGMTVFFLILLIITMLTSESVSLKTKEKITVGHICNRIIRTDPEILAERLGIQTDKYMFNCNLIGKKPDLEKLIITRVLAVIIAILGVLVALLLNSLLVSAFIGVATAAITVLVFVSSTQTVNDRAKKKKVQFESELPRFLDLFQTALKIDLPVATAIKITAESIDGLLSEELLKALVETELGTSNWQDSLYAIAQKYEVDSFSDFVLDIVTAFQKGSDIIESVERQSRSIKQSMLLNAKEQAARVTSLILLPVVIFKMIPLMVILFLPVVLQILNGM